MNTDTQARRTPPRRSNPDATPSSTPPAPPVAAPTIPWKTLILTTALSTFTGYVVIELVKGVHRAAARRREEKKKLVVSEVDLKPEEDNPGQPGARGHGLFALPTPETNRFASTTLPQMGFARVGNPMLSDVSTPVGELRHEVQNIQRSVDDRLARMERILMAQHQQQFPREDVA